MRGKRKKYDVFVIAAGPNEYAAVLRPTPEGADPYESKLERYNPFPDLEVFLHSRTWGIFAEWARAEFNEVVATRMIRYIRTKEAHELLTLTKLELGKLREKMLELGVKKTP